VPEDQKVTSENPNTAHPTERKSRLALGAAVARGCEVLAKRWNPQLLVLLLEGPARFSELASAIPGLSRRMMTERLRELQDARLVERNVDPGPPITSTYRLTPEGEQLRPTLEELCSWAERWDSTLTAS
jgi:DNA-binding HxlR family transcriptional regulator